MSSHIASWLASTQQGGINMNGSEVRKFIKQGEQASEVLVKLGYEYSTKEGEHPHWVAPVKPLDCLKDRLEDLIKLGIEEGIKARLKEDPRGPNWHLVAPMVGTKFSVRPECIPLNHQLHAYDARAHFMGKLFDAAEIRYHQSKEYTGYAVLFHFRTKFHQTEVVWLPLSAVTFRN